MSVHLVVQRYRSCKILIDEAMWISLPVRRNEQTDSHCGLLVYVSFAETDKPPDLQHVAETILNLPVMTTGLWGDGVSKTVSIKDLAAIGEHRTSLALVPQANLISKVRGSGKQIQYHGQIDKDAGLAQYLRLVDCLRAAILEHQCETTQQPLPNWYLLQKKVAMDLQASKQLAESLQSQPPLSTPPKLIFQDPAKYSAWDECGVPSCTITGEAVAKSAVKKMKKIQDAHRKRHEKWRSANPDDELTTALSQDINGHALKQGLEEFEQPTEQEWLTALDDSFCQFVAGSFGRRQGLELHSNMGPFCHVFQM